MKSAHFRFGMISTLILTSVLVGGSGCGETKRSQKVGTRGGTGSDKIATTSEAPGGTTALKINGANSVSLDTGLTLDSAVLGFSNVASSTFTSNLNVTMTVGTAKKSLTFRNDFGEDTKTLNVYYANTTSWQPDLAVESDFRAGVNSVCIASGNKKCAEYIIAMLIYYKDSSGTQKFMSLGLGVKAGETVAKSITGTVNYGFDYYATQFGFTSEAVVAAMNYAGSTATATTDATTNVSAKSESGSSENAPTPEKAETATSLPKASASENQSEQTPADAAAAKTNPVEGDEL